jgi:8-oxo-dGTP pyrophosphatase MutT (NUDIX family)
MSLINKMIKLFFELFHFLRKKYWKIFKIKTFGVRVLVFKDHKILLVKHRYGKFWIMPGGGINKNEKPESAGIRETHEEAGVIVQKIDFQLGYYKNTTGGKKDNIHCFVATEVQEIPNYKRKLIDFLEIQETGWFNINNLPLDTSSATKARINEFLADKRDLVGSW